MNKTIFQKFLDELKNPLMQIVNKTFHTKISISQKKRCYETHLKKGVNVTYKTGGEFLC